MDCIEFNKNIDAYLKNELDDAELNRFLCHLRECRKCSEELEINYIVYEGVSRLDGGSGGFDIEGSFRKSTRDREMYIMYRKNMIRLSYIVRTTMFWSLLCIVIIFIRIYLKGY